MIEKKVSAGSLSAGAAGVVLWFLSTYLFKGSAVPSGVVSLVYLAVPAALSLLAGYLAPHTPRPAPPAAPVRTQGGYAAGGVTVSDLPPPPATTPGGTA